jgi:hypothetical protein
MVRPCRRWVAEPDVVAGDPGGETGIAEPGDVEDLVISGAAEVGAQTQWVQDVVALERGERRPGAAGDDLVEQEVAGVAEVGGSLAGFPVGVGVGADDALKERLAAVG